jgi:hypothetical protein
MRFSLDYLNAVLPPSNPPLESVPVPVQRAFGASEPFGESEGSSFPEDEGPNITRRSAFWTYAIFSEFGDGSVQPTTMPGPFCPAWWWWRWWWCWWQKWNQPKQRFKALFSVGAFDRDFEGPGFGLIIESPFLQRSQIIDELFFPRLNRSFPVAARPLVEDLHAVPSLINATSTCWATDKPSTYSLGLRDLSARGDGYQGRSEGCIGRRWNCATGAEGAPNDRCRLCVNICAAGFPAPYELRHVSNRRAISRCADIRRPTSAFCCRGD